ncbi:Fcf2-domain-containing protein [Trichodelitschia bisporula]|uniref:Fcf2-domain-containing protein n=1 Tax=Trichodelitschia bisporula TaxID=703511 RepID=A0A6G1IB05_9PEZI|nr:Fcf2-domain-containing protein [Trichodelitschia bisporula]
MASSLDQLPPEKIDELLQQAEGRLKAGETTCPNAATVKTRFPKLDVGTLPTPYVQQSGPVVCADSKALVPSSQRTVSEKPRTLVDPVLVRQRRKNAPDTLPDWYNIPRTNLTTELKRDLQLLNMRSVLDPKRMYKKQGKFKIPEYSQVGQIVEGPTEFYSARLRNKDRKETFVEDALAGEVETGRFKRKYEEVQTKKTSGKKAFYKALKAKRSKHGKG